MNVIKEESAVFRIREESLGPSPSLNISFSNYGIGV